MARLFEIYRMNDEDGTPRSLNEQRHTKRAILWLAFYGGIIALNIGLIAVMIFESL